MKDIVWRIDVFLDHMNVLVQIYQVEKDISNYAVKFDLTGATSIDTFMLASKEGLASLKTKLGNLDVNRVKSFLVDLSKLRNVGDNSTIKNIVYDEMVIKINTTCTKILSKIQHVSDKQGLENKIEHVKQGNSQY